MTTITAGSTNSFDLNSFEKITIRTGGRGVLTLTSGAPDVQPDLTLQVKNGTFGPYCVPMAASFAMTEGSADYTIAVVGKIDYFTSLYSKLLTARQRAYLRNPFDLQTTASTALVTSVTIPTSTASLSNPQAISYVTTAGAYDAIQVDNIPYKDCTYATDFVVGGNLHATKTSDVINPVEMIGVTGSGFASMQTGQGAITNYIARARVVIGAANTNFALIFTGLTNISSNYYPIWVNGIPVAPSAASITNNMLQINFAAAGVYDVAIGFQQSLSFGGITIDQDDWIFPATERRLPIVLFGDSYTNGTSKTPSNAQAHGDLTLASAISWIGGVNCITHGVSSTGLVNDGTGKIPANYTASSFSYSYTGRLQYVVALANASAAPLIVVQGSYNDTTAVGITAAIAQSQATTILNYLLANTTCNIVLTGVFPGNLNNSATVQLVDAGYLAAVNAINSNRLAFVPVAGATQPWIIGGKNTAGTGSGAGSSRYFTCPDGIHLSGLLTANQNIPANTVSNSGIEFMARKLLDAISQIALERNW